jgi:hypothetical protein
MFIMRVLKLVVDVRVVSDEPELEILSNPITVEGLF